MRKRWALPLPANLVGEWTPDEPFEPPPRDSEILRLRDAGWTLAKIGTHLRISGARVGELERRARRRILRGV